MRLRALVQPSGRIGPALNSTIWGILALRQAGRDVPPESRRYLTAHQSRSGGFAWVEGGAPDSNTTAAAVEALGRGAATTRALAYLRRLQGRDGGFALSPGRDSDAQSTAWAIQAFLAAGQKAPAGARAYLARLRRPDGSYRYSARYATTPVWVTAQVLAALAAEAAAAAGRLTQPGATRSSRPSSTSRATSARHENHPATSRSGATTAARTPATTSSSSPPPADGAGRT